MRLLLAGDAFSVFAIAATAMIVANVVTGVVISSYRDVGAMRSIGFTPRQVAVAAVGAWLPARWAARGPVAGVLQAE